MADQYLERHAKTNKSSWLQDEVCAALAYMVYTHSDPYWMGFITSSRWVEKKPSTPPILMTKAVFDGFRAARPDDKIIKEKMLRRIRIDVPGYSGPVFGGDVIYTAFKK